MVEPIPSRMAALLQPLQPKVEKPNSKNVLDAWIAHAAAKIDGGRDTEAGRLGWLIASTVAVAVVQRAVDGDGRKLFLLKGGTLLQHRLSATARATSDIDGLIRGDIDDFFAELDAVIAVPWGSIAIRRSELETINVRSRVLKPRRYDLYL